MKTKIDLWISIKDELPEPGKYVLGGFKGGVFSSLLQRDGLGRFYPYGSPQEEKRITHWMGLPETSHLES